MIDVAGMVEDSITDGPGLRFALFVQGCPHRCPGCHNPETHRFGVGVPWTAEALFRKIRRNPLVRGVTFSGGEPFAQAAGLLELARLLAQDGYELAIYTGYTFEELAASPDRAVRALLACADVLIDGPFRIREKDYELGFRGSRNQRVLDVPASLAAGVAIPLTDGRWGECSGAERENS